MSNDITELRALVAAATPGPWTAELDRFGFDGGIVATIADAGTNMLAKIETEHCPPEDADVADHNAAWARAKEGQELKDARFIAAARTTIPALLDRIDELELECKRLRNLAVVLADGNAEWQEECLWRRAAMRRLHAQVDQTNPRCPVGAALTLAGAAQGEYGPEDVAAVLAASDNAAAVEPSALRGPVALFDVLTTIRADIDEAIRAHDPGDPRHRSRGGQQHNGPCCVLGAVNPGAVRALRDWRDAIDRVVAGAVDRESPPVTGSPPVLDTACRNCGVLFESSAGQGPCPKPSPGVPLVDCGRGGHFFDVPVRRASRLPSRAMILDEALKLAADTLERHKRRALQTSGAAFKLATFVLKMFGAGLPPAEKQK